MSARTASREREYTAPRLYEIAFDMNRKARSISSFTASSASQASGPARPRHRVRHRAAPGPAGRAGYQAAGLDLSARNIEYLGERLADKGLKGDLVVGDMTDFRLKRPVDSAICMQDSQGHLLTNAQLLAHLRSVGRNLRKGGLYIFDRYMASSWTNPARSWSWSRRRGGLIVRASFSALNDVNPVSQVFKEHMTLEAVENGTHRVYRQTHLSRMVFPQELRGLVVLAGGFEFVQWFFGFKPHQVLERSRHPLLMVVVLRKR